MNDQTEILAWHFLPADQATRYANPVRVEVGQTLRLPEGVRPILCEQGFHASLTVRDALKHAPGHVLCRVRLGGIIVHDDDKSVASERTCVWMVSEETVLRTLVEWACWCAEEALGLIPSPDPRSLRAIEVTRLWTEGKATTEEVRAAARAAARAADAAYAANAAAYAAYAARAAADAARAAARAAADAAHAAYAARAAADAAYAAYAAADAAYAYAADAYAADAAADAAANAANARQTEKLEEMFMALA